MNWDEAQGEAKRFRGMLLQKWARLTADDLLLLEGPRELFISRLQQRVGGDMRELARQFDALASSVELDRKHVGVIHLAAS